MYRKKLAAFAAAMALVAANPAIAQSAQALSPSAHLSSARAGAAMENESALGGGSGGLWAAAIGIALLAAVAVVIFVDDDDENLPTSP